MMRGIESGIVYTRFLTRRIDHVPGHAWPDTSGSSFASSTAVMQVGCTSARMIYEVFHTVSAMSNLPALLRALKKTLRSVSDPSLSLSIPLFRLVRSIGRRYIFDYIGKMSVSMVGGMEAERKRRKGKESLGRKILDSIVLPEGGGRKRKKE